MIRTIPTEVVWNESLGNTWVKLVDANYCDEVVFTSSNGAEIYVGATTSGQTKPQFIVSQGSIVEVAISGQAVWAKSITGSNKNCHVGLYHVYIVPPEPVQLGKPTITDTSITVAYGVPRGPAANHGAVQTQVRHSQASTKKGEAATPSGAYAAYTGSLTGLTADRDTKIEVQLSNGKGTGDSVVFEYRTEPTAEEVEDNDD